MALTKTPHWQRATSYAVGHWDHYGLYVCNRRRGEGRRGLCPAPHDAPSSSIFSRARLQGFASDTTKHQPFRNESSGVHHFIRPRQFTTRRLMSLPSSLRTSSEAALSWQSICWKLWDFTRMYPIASPSGPQRQRSTSAQRSSGMRLRVGEDSQPPRNPHKIGAGDHFTDRSSTFRLRMSMAKRIRSSQPD